MIENKQKKKSWKPDKEVELGRLIEEDRDIVVRKTTYDGKDFLDIRIFLKTPLYRGFTKFGVAIAVEKSEELMNILKKIIKCKRCHKENVKLSYEGICDSCWKEGDLDMW